MIIIFTSCYNQATYLSQAIESVLNQSYKDFRYILIDDGSTDNTKEIIKYYAEKDNRIISYFLSKSSTLGHIINRSFYILPEYKAWLWLPADDLLEKDILLKKLNLLSGTSIIFSYGKIINEKNNYIGQISFSWSSSEEFKKKIWDDCFIGMTGVLISKKTIDIVGGFPEHLKYSEDYYWLLKSTLFHNIEYKYVPEFLYSKRIHTNRLSYKYHPEIIKNIPLIKKEILAWNKK